MGKVREEFSFNFQLIVLSVTRAFLVKWCVQPATADGAAGGGTDPAGRRSRRESERSATGGSRGKKTAATTAGSTAAPQSSELPREIAAEIHGGQDPLPEIPTSGGSTSEHESENTSGTKNTSEDDATVPATELQTSDVNV